MPATTSAAHHNSLIASARSYLQSGRAFCLCSFPQNGDGDGLRLFAETASASRFSFVVQNWKGNLRLEFAPADDTNADFAPAQSLFATLPDHTTYQVYRRGFERMMAAFGRGEAKKAVLSRIKRVEKPKDFDPLTFFEKIAKEYPHALCYLLAHPRTGLWIGATPEALLHSSGPKWHTHSLAGTMALQAKRPYDWTPKEREEQALVSMHIREVLKESKIDGWNETGPETIEAGSVAHLRTVFNFAPPPYPQRLIDSLHPTPAVAGLPVDAAVHLIQEAESHERGLYTGYLGIQDLPHSCQLYVNLRCLQVGEDGLALYLGGGLTPGSTLEAEWEETNYKALTLEKLLNG